MPSSISRTIAPLTWLALIAAPATADAARVVYVNVEPVTVQSGINDPTTDSINLNNFMDTDFDGWSGSTDEQQQLLLALLKDTSVPFDIVFTLERPAMGPYDMVVFGSADDHASSFGGTCSTQVGIADCGDAGGESIAFSFWGCLGEEDQLDPERVAFHTLGALGYGWGLENIAGNGQVMSGWSNSALRFGDACANINGGGSGCPHEGCDMGQQNSTADLLATLGARVDDGPPEIVVIEPTPGADVSSPFDVAVEVVDDFGGITAELSIVELDAPPVVDDAYPYRWDAVDLGAGPTPLTLEVKAIDADGNEVTAQIPVCVGGGCPDMGGEESGDTGETSDSGAELGETGSASATAGAEEDGGSSGCSTAPSEGRGLAILMLLGLLGVRRRARGC